jgi:hypothetical protein
MPHQQKKPAPKSAPRPRRRSVKKKAPEPEGLITGPPGGADRGSRGRRESSRLADQVVLVALAILFGVIGFAVHFVWFGSIVLMAVLLGLIASEMRSRRGKSVISEVVTTVMVEAKSVAEAIASGGDNVPEPEGTHPQVMNSLSAFASTRPKSQGPSRCLGITVRTWPSTNNQKETQMGNQDKG